MPGVAKEAKPPAAKSSSVIDALPNSIRKDLPQDLRSDRFLQQDAQVSVYEPAGYHESGRERTIANLLASNGLTVVLRNKAEGSGVKSPDAYVNFDGDFEPVEFKSIGERASNVFNAADQQLRNALSQARNVLIYIDRADYNKALDEIVAGVQARMTRAAQQKKAMHRIIVLMPDGVAQEIDQ